jgi:hypothetical protein
MTDTEDVSEAESARTATLRRIGRNLVNAQRIELMLKFLLTVKFSAPLGDIEGRFKNHVERISRKTLGALIPDLTEAVFVPANATDSKGDLKEIWLVASLSIPIPAEVLSAWSEEWETLRTERNKLVHLMLGHVDFNSPEQCRRLDPELDAQNVLFLNGIGFLGPLVTATKAQLAKMASGEFDLEPPLPEAPQN